MNEIFTVLGDNPSIKSRGALVLLHWSLMLRTPYRWGYRGWLRFRYELLNQWLEERGKLECYYCGRSPLYVIHSDFNMEATLDHFIPTSKGGGKFDKSNLVVACHRCNQKKADTIPTQPINEQKKQTPI